jgi:hypothetical protein
VVLVKLQKPRLPAKTFVGLDGKKNSLPRPPERQTLGVGQKNPPARLRKTRGRGETTSTRVKARDKRAHECLK